MVQNRVPAFFLRLALAQLDETLVLRVTIRWCFVSGFPSIIALRLSCFGYINSADNCCFNTSYQGMSWIWTVHHLALMV